MLVDTSRGTSQYSHLELKKIDQKADKELIPPVSDYRSLTKSHHDFVIVRLSHESNADIIFHLKKYLEGVSAFLKSAVDGNQDIIFNLYDITIKYLQDKLGLIKIGRDKTVKIPGKIEVLNRVLSCVRLIR